MGSLGETFRDADGLRRLYVGTGLLLLGVVIAVPGLVRVVAGVFGGLGLSDAVAARAAIGTAGIAVPAAFLALLFAIGGDPAVRRVGLAGGSLAAAAALVHGVIGPVGMTAPPLWLGLLYLVGVGVALWAPIAAAAAAVQDRPSRPGVRSVTVPSTRGTRGPAADRRVPADGGREDEDLRFPLDRDD